MDPNERSPEPVLTRGIGLLSAVGFGLGAMIGTGVFVYVAIGAGLAGPAVLLSLLLAGLAATCNGLSSAELAAAYPRSGGTYEYAGRLLSPGVGFLAGWLFLAAKTSSAAATALAFGRTLEALTGLPAMGASFALVAGVTLLNLFRLTKAGVLNLVLVLLSVGSLVVFIVTGVADVRVDRFTPFAPLGLRGVLSAAALLFVAFAGYGRIATLGEEVENPRRTIPIAVVASLGIAVLLYLLVAAVAIGRIGAELFAAAAEGGSPLVAASRSPGLGRIVSLGALGALASVFLNLQLGLSRMTFAMARGRDLPQGLASVNGSSSPWAAVLFVGLLVGGLVAARSIVALLSISAFTVLVYYSLTNLSALKLPPPDRRVPPLIPAVGLTSCFALAASVPLKHLGAGALILGAGLLWRLLWRSRA